MLCGEPRLIRYFLETWIQHNLEKHLEIFLWGTLIFRKIDPSVEIFKNVWSHLDWYDHVLWNERKSQKAYLKINNRQKWAEFLQKQIDFQPSIKENEMNTVEVEIYKNNNINKIYLNNLKQGINKLITRFVLCNIRIIKFIINVKISYVH